MSWIFGCRIGLFAALAVGIRAANGGVFKAKKSEFFRKRWKNRWFSWGGVAKIALYEDDGPVNKMRDAGRRGGRGRWRVWLHGRMGQFHVKLLKILYVQTNTMNQWCVFYYKSKIILFNKLLGHVWWVFLFLFYFLLLIPFKGTTSFS